MTNVLNMPHSAEAEAQILGAVLGKPWLFESVAEQITAGDLFMPVHVSIFEAMERVAARGRPTELIIVSDEMKAAGVLSRVDGGESGLHAMAMSGPEADRIPALVKLVLDRSLQRKLIANCLEIAGAAQSDQTDPAELIDQLGGRLVQLSQASARELTPIGEHLDGIVRALEARQVEGKQVTGVPTGIMTIDHITGGLQPGNQVVIAGRPGEGKTAWALGIARRLVKAGGAAVFFSLEMSRDELLERLLCQEGQLDSAMVRSGSTHDLWSAINGAVDRLTPAMLYIVDDQFSFRQIRATTRRFRARHPAQQVIAVIDYIQLLDMTAGLNVADAIGEVSRGIKRLAKALKMPIISVSQLNRSSEKEERPPRMSDLRSSGNIEQDADIIVFTYNPQRIEQGEVDLLMPKNRNGRAGAVKAHWIGKHYSFESAAPRSYHEPDEA